MPTNYTGPITTVAPSLFPVITDPSGKFFTTSDGRRISWSDIVEAVQQAGFLEEIFMSAGAGISITGAGTEDAPFVVAATAAGGNSASIVAVANLAELQGVGNPDTVYFVFDTDGQGTNGIYAWNADASAYQDMGGGGSGGGVATVRSPISATGLTGFVRHAGGAPVLTGGSGSYTLTVPTGCDLQGMNLYADAGPAATDGSNNLSIDNVSTDGHSEYGIFEVIDMNTGDAVDEHSVSLQPNYSEPDAGTVRVLFDGIGIITSFRILFSPCA